MPRVTIVQVVYNNKRFMEAVFSAIYRQTFKNFNVVAVISGNDDSGKEYLQEHFPQVEIIDPGYNIGFAAGHNLVFEKYGTPAPSPRSDEASANLGEERGGGEVADFFQLVNPDLVLEPDYIEKMLQVFEDPKVGAATGKLYQIDRDQIDRDKIFNNWPHVKGSASGRSKILDSTGVIISKSGRARDRGQHEVDNGQYDNQIVVDGVSGAGPMYRASALKAIKISHYNAISYHSEYFDEDFHSYWEDVDLSWRMKTSGWKNVFVPGAIGYHGRGSASSPGGYIHVIDFIKHHKNLSPRVRQLNYQNHIFMYIKNSDLFYPQFFVREFFMLGYIVLFEISTLKVVPNIIKLLPKMWKKRKMIKEKVVPIS